MNLEEWLEKMKEKPDTVWCKSNAYPPNKCRHCSKGLYKRGVYKHSRFLTDINTYCCTACKEERERAKQRDPFFEFDTDWPVSFLQEEEESREWAVREAYSGVTHVEKESKEQTKEERVHGALRLLQKEFKEVKIIL